MKTMIVIHLCGDLTNPFRVASCLLRKDSIFWLYS